MPSPIVPLILYSDELERCVKSPHPTHQHLRAPGTVLKPLEAALSATEMFRQCIRSPSCILEARGSQLIKLTQGCLTAYTMPCLGIMLSSGETGTTPSLGHTVISPLVDEINGE